MYLPGFQAAGRTLSSSGLISGASGNLSIRLQDHIFITRHGSVLSALTSTDLIETGIYADDSATPLASCELPIHRAIYTETSAHVIVHAHPPSAVTLSLINGGLELPGGVVAVGTSAGIVAGVLSDEIARELKKNSLVMVRGHGSFAIGKTLLEVCRATLRFEEDCTAACRERALMVKKPTE